MENLALKYLRKRSNKADFLHTSSFGKAQSGSGIGAASSQSFNTRMAINQNRRVVRGYGDSRIVTGTRYTNSRAKTYTASEDKALGVGRTGLRESGGSVSNRPKGGNAEVSGVSRDKPRASSPRPVGIKLPRK